MKFNLSDDMIRVFADTEDELDGAELYYCTNGYSVVCRSRERDGSFVMVLKKVKRDA